MKKGLLFTLVFVLLLSLAACKTAEADPWGIYLQAENVTPTGMTLVITQSGGNPTGTLQYGNPYSLEVLKGGEWEAVPYATDETVAWTMPAYILSMEDSTSTEIHWEWPYGSLSAGTYRLNKEFMDFRKTGDYDNKTYYAEFEIE